MTKMEGKWDRCLSKPRVLKKREEDGSITTFYTLEVKGLNKLHNFEGPALVNEKNRNLDNVDFWLGKRAQAGKKIPKFFNKIHL